jgi:hypothetical protein
MTLLCTLLTLLLVVVYVEALRFVFLVQTTKKWHWQRLAIGFMIILSVVVAIILLYLFVAPLPASSFRS